MGAGIGAGVGAGVGAGAGVEVLEGVPGALVDVGMRTGEGMGMGIGMGIGAGPPAARTLMSAQFQNCSPQPKCPFGPGGPEQEPDPAVHQAAFSPTQ